MTQEYVAILLRSQSETPRFDRPQKENRKAFKDAKKALKDAHKKGVLYLMEDGPTVVMFTGERIPLTCQRP